MDDNKMAINNVKLSLKRDHAKIVKKGVNTTKLKTYLNSKDNNSKGILIGSSIPAVITIAVGSLGVVTLSVAAIISKIGNDLDPNFSNNAKDVMKVMESSKELIGKMSLHTIVNLCIPASILIFLKTKLNKKTTRYKNAKFYTTEEFKKLEEIEKELDVINGIEKEDKTFAKYFLDKVDISKNSKDYNKELIRRLTEEEEIINGKPRNQENILEFLENSSIEEGASKEYLHSLGIKTLRKK